MEFPTVIQRGRFGTRDETETETEIEIEIEK
jgi:hypothetical protein